MNFVRVVVKNCDKKRLSFVFFLEPSLDTLVKPIKLDERLVIKRRTDNIDIKE